MHRCIARTLALVALFSFVSTAHAKPQWLGAFNSNYPTATKLTTCGVCHTNFSSNSSRNPYGLAFKNAGGPGDPSAAFTAIENVDSDGDGTTNGVEILTEIGFYPGWTCDTYASATNEPADIADFVDPSDRGCMGVASTTLVTPTSTTTTTTTTTTPTTLPIGCALAPATDCVAPGKGVLLVNEKKVGKEKLKVSLTKLQPAVVQSQFGDPVGGSTSYAVCIYDDADQLSGEVLVARAGDVCGSQPKPCWNVVSSKGYKYGDKSTAADGILKMVMTGGEPGKGKIVIIGKNKVSAQQESLPIGIALSLQDNSRATVQVVTSDAACFGVTVADVKKADGSIFSAVGP